MPGSRGHSGTLPRKNVSGTPPSSRPPRSTAPIAGLARMAAAKDAASGITSRMPQSVANGRMKRTSSTHPTTWPRTIVRSLVPHTQNSLPRPPARGDLELDSRQEQLACQHRVDRGRLPVAVAIGRVQLERRRRRDAHRLPHRRFHLDRCCSQDRRRGDGDRGHEERARRRPTRAESCPTVGARWTFGHATTPALTSAERSTVSSDMAIRGVLTRLFSVVKVRPVTRPKPAAGGPARGCVEGRCAGRQDGAGDSIASTASSGWSCIVARTYAKNASS